MSREVTAGPSGKIARSCPLEFSMSKPISPLRQRMTDDMKLRNMSPATQGAYVRAVKNLSAFLGRSPDQLTFEDVRAYQLHLVSPASGDHHSDHVCYKVLLRNDAWQAECRRAHSARAQARHIAGSPFTRRGYSSVEGGTGPQVSHAVYDDLRGRPSCLGSGLAHNRWSCIRLK